MVFPHRVLELHEFAQVVGVSIMPDRLRGVVEAPTAGRGENRLCSLMGLGSMGDNQAKRPFAMFALFPLPNARVLSRATNS